MTDLLALANPLQGTRSIHSFSRGNTLPFIGSPFAMTSWAMQTADGRWYFHPDHRQVRGVRATRQASPWMGDYGHFTLMPQVGERRLAPARRSSAYRPHEATFQPHFLRFQLVRYETHVELTATPRAMIMRLVFPTGAREKRLLLETYPGQARIEIDPARRAVRGYTRANSGGTPSNFASYFILKFDCELAADQCGLFREDEAFGGAEGTDDALGAIIGLRPPAGGAVTVRVGTSFISLEQAERNLAGEIGDRALETVRDDVAADWRDLLDRFEIDADSDHDRRTFASCLYRAFLFPRRWHEPDAQGNPIHFSPHNGDVVPGVMYSDNGFWDTHRTVYPFFSLVCPSRMQEMLEGWVNVYKESDWLPRWVNPGETGGMIGTHIDAVLADAVMKGLRGFDVEAGYAGMVKQATREAPARYGRAGIEAWIRHGYLPADAARHSVSATLDYAFGDFCIGQVAGALGKIEERDLMWRRAMNYRRLFDRATGFMRARDEHGRWIELFDEFMWGGPYVEGSAWQCSWAVPHDPAGLAELLGGDEALVARLDRMLALPPIYRADEYGEEIHEMTEMACADFGQYAHNNQPVHHVLYLYAAAGRPDRTQSWVRRVLTELYGPGPDGFIGDEDNGEMACWYLLSALGIYPLCVGRPEYVLGSPLFRRAVLRLEQGGELLVDAPANSPKNVYVRRVAWNGAPHSRVVIDHRDLAQGGTLAFEMTDRPEWTEVAQADRPFSLSRLFP